MEWKLFWQIALIAMCSVGFAVLLGGIGKANEDKFDERQMVERGRAAQLAMNTALIYLLAIYAGLLFDWIDLDNVAVMAVFGLVLTTIVNGGYCIFHDAYLERGQKAGSVIVHRLLLGAAWLSMGWFQRKWNAVSAWVDVALGIGYASDGVLLLARWLMSRIEEKRDGKE